MAPQIVWCDNKDCIFYDEECGVGECGVYRLDIKGGVCVGHPRSGRNVTSNDVVEKLKDENEKLREFANTMRVTIKDACGVCDEVYCSSYDEEQECCRFDSVARSLGIEVE